MSKISEYTDKVKTFVDDINKQLSDISDDQDRLLQIIQDLNNNPGPISAEDQALLDEGLSLLEAVSNKTKALNSKVEDTPPAPPGP